MDAAGAQRLADEAQQHLMAGRLSDAADAYRRLVDELPDDPASRHNLGNVLCELKRWDDAIAAYESALRIDDSLYATHHALATALRNTGRLRKAIDHYRAACRLNPASVPAAGDLGAALMAAGQVDEAERVLMPLVRSGVAAPQPYRNLAMVYLHRGRFAEAATLLERRLAMEPTSRAHHELGVALARAGRPAEAAHRFRQAVAMEPDFGPAVANLALVLEDMGKTQDAVVALREARRLEPGSAVIAFHLAALGGCDAPPACPPHYVVELFDNYAARFDDHLVEQLHYRGPQLVRDAAALAWQGTTAASTSGGRDISGGDVIDLGCGTGLCGVLVRPLARRLIGVDLSPRMIERAQRRRVYDELVTADAVAALSARHGDADLIIAADLLIYLGDLSPLFTAAAAALRPAGLFIFTIETTAEGDYRLLPTRRYAHSLAYIRRLADAHGFDVPAVTESTLRAGGSDEDVQGAVVTLRRR
jgi:predicted TPR repeat methyltransferase